MPRISLDGAALEQAPPATWGLLLTELDDWLAAQARIVTDVRFDGVDEPAFREPETLERELAGHDHIEIISGTPDGLMDRCLDEAIAAVTPLSRAAVDVGEQYRGHDVMPANRGLMQLAEGLSSLIGIVGAAGLALQMDLQQLPCGDGVAATVVGELGAHLESLIAAQEAGDWITVADLLQYDVAPSLSRLTPVLQSLRLGQTLD